MREIAQNLAMALPAVRRLALRRHVSLGDERVTVGDKYAAYRRHLVFLGMDIAGKTVLELGPGRDLGSLHLAWDDGAIGCSAVDILPYVDRTERTEYRIYDGRSLPFTEASFDILWSWGVLEHIRYPEALAQEMFRVLRPGGVVIARVDLRDHYHLDDEAEWNAHLEWSTFWWRAQKWWRAAYTNRLRLSDWLSVFAEAGFEGGARELQRSPLLAGMVHRWPWLTGDDAAVIGFDGVWTKVR